MGWRRNRNWTLKRKHQNHWHVSHVYTTVTTDRQGNTVSEKWNSLWSKHGKHIRWAKRHTNHQLRAAAKLQLAYELYEDEQWQDELWEDQISDDEEFLDFLWDDYLADEMERELMDDRDDLCDPYWYEDYYMEDY